MHVKYFLSNKLNSSTTLPNIISGSIPVIFFYSWTRFNCTLLTTYLKRTCVCWQVYLLYEWFVTLKHPFECLDRHLCYCCDVSLTTGGSSCLLNGLTLSDGSSGDSIRNGQVYKCTCVKGTLTCETGDAMGGYWSCKVTDLYQSHEMCWKSTHTSAVWNCVLSAFVWPGRKENLSLCHKIFEVWSFDIFLNKTMAVCDKVHKSGKMFSSFKNHNKPMTENAQKTHLRLQIKKKLRYLHWEKINGYFVIYSQLLPHV